jgi:hypothetical protein
MKTNFFKAVAISAIAVLCGQTANAQNNEIINADTTQVGQQVSNQKVGQTTRPATVRVKKVVKTAAREDSVIYKNGTSEVYADQAVAQMSDETLDGILSGDIKAVKRTNKNYDGELRRAGYIGAVGGAVFGDTTDPMVGLMVGYRTWNWDFAFSGYWSQGHLPANSDEPGERYNSMYFYLDAVWKALHTSNGYWSFGPGLGAGYGMQKTNDLDLGGSTNSGVTGRAFLAMSYQATRHLTLGLKAGAMLKVLVDHAENGTEWQEISKNTIKPFVAAEVKINF